MISLSPGRRTLVCAAIAAAGMGMWVASKATAGAVLRLVSITTDHPADLNDNGQIDVSEISQYASAFLRGQAWSRPPTTIPISYVTRGAQIFLQGEDYHYDSTMNPPWAPGIAPPPPPVFRHAARSAAGAVRLAGRTTRAPAARENLDSVFRTVDARAQGFHVVVQVRPSLSAHAYAAEELIPIQWSPSNISAGGVYNRSQHEIRWLFMDRNPRAFTYDITRLPGASVIAPDLRGAVSIDGSLVPITNRTRGI